MVTAETMILNASGLHARPASVFSAEAGKYLSKITIKNLTADSAAVNAKSIMRVLTLAMSKGTKVQISAEGDDEKEAVAHLVDLIENRLNEDQL